MENYKEKYECALETIQEILSSGSDSIMMSRLKLRLQSVFPELKESEDELTWLTKFIEEETRSLSMDIRDNEDSIKLKNLKKSLAWLEKQGINYSLVEEIKKRKDSFMREKEKAVSYDDKLSLGARIAMLEELLVFVKEKQGEQKPA